MLLTTEEARTKSCPQYSPDLARDCTGSDCMAWRWGQALIEGPDSYMSDPAPKGYCGLAGKPVDLE